MKAFVLSRYGSPELLRFEELPTPVPRAGAVLVKVHASSVNAADWHIMRGKPALFRLAIGIVKPKIPVLGLDIAGVVEAVGPGVTRFAPGDRVFGDISGHGFGGFAEYACVPEEPLARIPDNLSFTEAAAVPVAAVTALQALRDTGEIRPNSRVLIHGAGGGVGTFAVQLALHFGTTVTAVCGARNVELMHELGVEDVIDYAKADCVRRGRSYDLVLGANGSRSIFAYRRLLRPTGVYVSSGGDNRQFMEAALLGPVLSASGNYKLRGLLARPNGADLACIATLLESGAIRPVIDRRFPFGQIPVAIHHVESGRARGKVVIDFDADDGGGAPA